MPSIFDELREYFLDKVPITSKCGSGDDFRMFNDHIKQGVNPPFIRVEVFEGFSSEHLGGITGQIQSTLQIDAYDKTPTLAWDLAEAIRLAPLQQYRGLINTTHAKVSAPDGYETGNDPPERASDKVRYWVSRDYTFTYTEATS